MPQINHIFVLMLENRSFDHMLGFAGISVTDAQSGAQTTVNGLTGTESNSYQGQQYSVTPTATDPMPVDPGHEFLNVLEQLCGTNIAYPHGGPYPPINNSGFVASYAAPSDVGRILSCHAQGQLTVLQTLATAFAVCDSWHASMPGPTVPNRLFALAASSSGLDHSPAGTELISWQTLGGLEFQNGSIFDALGAGAWRIYSGGDFPLAAILKGVELGDALPLDDFAADVANPEYPCKFTWIEPDYGDFVLGTYKGGTSQHPLDGVAGGEGLIKRVYEAIRSSPLWEQCLLIITWDEHGGFYDHVAPPAAIPPGDTQPGSKYNQYGFAFDRYGVRVPAVVVSPYVAANVIDHRLYDHSSIPKTVQDAFTLKALTARDGAARSLLPLLSLQTARQDAPMDLPTPASAPAAASQAELTADARPQQMAASVDGGNLPGFLHSAMRRDLALSPPDQRQAILARVQGIRTRAQAAQYLTEVSAKVRAARTGH